VPLLDTTLVTVTRVLAGRSIAKGGLDHSTYRLIALGLSESQVAGLLYAFAAGGGLVAIGLTRLDHGLGYLLGTAFLVGMSLLAAYLGRIQIGSADRVGRLKPATVLVQSLFYKRRLAEILLDVVLVTLAYYGAYRSKFDGALPPASRLSFRSLEGLRQRFQRKGRRVLIYGADDGGELTLRELRTHAELGLRPVCFVDDDARRHGAEIHGVPIVAGFDSLAWV